MNRDSLKAGVDASVPRLIDQVSRIAPTLAGYLDLLSVDYRASWGGPMNGQAARRELVRRLFHVYDFDLVIETGTYRAVTTIFLASLTESPVVSVESNPRYATYSAVRLRSVPNATVIRDYSEDLLARLSRTSAPTEYTFFYLDAHWGKQVPLVAELKIITGSWKHFVIMIDDFKVPNDPGYRYDHYTSGMALTLADIEVADLQDTSIYFPSTPSAEETGARRGCAVIVPSHDANISRLDEKLVRHQS